MKKLGKLEDKERKENRIERRKNGDIKKIGIKEIMRIGELKKERDGVKEMRRIKEEIDFCKLGRNKKIEREIRSLGKMEDDKKRSIKGMVKIKKGKRREIKGKLKIGWDVEFGDV